MHPIIYKSKEYLQKNRYITTRHIYITKDGTLYPCFDTRAWLKEINFHI